MKRNRSIQGSAVATSPGIAIGRAQKLAFGRRPIPEHHIAQQQVADELARLDDAIQATLTELDEERPHLERMHSQEPLHILEAHRMVLLDPELTSAAKQRVEKQCINAEWALRKQLEDIGQVFDRIDDPYLRSRKADVEQVGQRILDHLMGEQEHAVTLDEDEPQILISDDFTPLEAVRLWRHGMAGFVAEQGGVNAHTIIIARGMGIPALMGAQDIITHVEDGDMLIVDGEKGIWIINPSQKELADYRAFEQAIRVARKSLQAFARRPSLSADGHELKLMANLEFIEEMPMALETGIDGVGLYRTEFLFLNAREQPDENMQYRYYVDAVRAMKGLPITFRLMDIGGDKPVLFQKMVGRGWNGSNPAMGLRGIRLLLDHPEFLQTQVCAMLRAAEEGPVQILLPMVSNVEEVMQVREILQKCQKKLKTKCEVPVGTMIEVPAAALIADELAEVSDFFSLGTNDLIQYTLAADRGDEVMADLYDPSHKAIHLLLRRSVLAAKKAGIPAYMCGEMASDTRWTETLMNMGFDALSMSLNNILMVRKHLSHLHYHPEKLA